jgi:hypothetical protein
VKKEHEALKETFRQTCLMLTEEQTRRILGISHIEKGRDTTLIIDEMLDRDASLRKTYKLSFKDTKNVADFLEATTRKSWKLPWLLTIMAKLWNSGFTHLDQQSLKLGRCSKISVTRLGNLTEPGSVQSLPSLSLTFS